MKKNFTHFYESPLGRITITSDGESLTGLCFGDHAFNKEDSFTYKDKLPDVLITTKQWLDVYFEGKKPEFFPKIALKNTEFREMVWQTLLNIPYGKTVTYGEIALQLAEKKGKSRMSAQAIGGAVAHNPIALIIPCHRVIGVNGSLTGYAWGIERKRKLLLLEKTGSLL